MITMYFNFYMVYMCSNKYMIFFSCISSFTLFLSLPKGQVLYAACQLTAIEKVYKQKPVKYYVFLRKQLVQACQKISHDLWQLRKPGFLPTVSGLFSIILVYYMSEKYSAKQYLKNLSIEYQLTEFLNEIVFPDFFHCKNLLKIQV